MFFIKIWRLKNIFEYVRASQAFWQQILFSKEFYFCLYPEIILSNPAVHKLDALPFSHLPGKWEKSLFRSLHLSSRIQILSLFSIRQNLSSRQLELSNLLVLDFIFWKAYSQLAKGVSLSTSCCLSVPLSTHALYFTSHALSLKSHYVDS